MGLLKDIVLPLAGVNVPGREKKKRSGSQSSSGGSGGGTYIGDEAAAGNYKRGGKVRHTGLARVHKGERVLTRKQDRAYSRHKRSSKR